MRVLITGGRDFADQNFADQAILFDALDRLHEQHGFTLLIHGDARGTDRLAGQWAEDRGVKVLACPANWRKHGREAGPIRNRQMLDENPDLVVALPGGKGTADMIRVATNAGLRVVRA